MKINAFTSAIVYILLSLSVQAKIAEPLSMSKTLCPDPPDSCIINSLPYTENFNSYTPNSPLFIPCWHRLDPWTSDINNSIYVTSSYGSKYLLIKQGNTSSLFQHVSLPLIDSALVASNDLMLGIHYYHSGTHTLSIPIEIGAKSDPTDTSGFRSFVQLPIKTSENEEYVRLDSLEPNEYLTIKTQLQGSNEKVNINEMSVDIVPPCGKLYQLRCSKKTDHGALVTWEYLPNSQCDSSVFIVNTYLSSNNTLVSSDTTHKKHALLYNLESETSYTVTITASCPDCGTSGTSTPPKTITFTTLDFYLYLNCTIPIVTLREATDDSITIEWTPDATDSIWNIYYSTESGLSSDWILLESNYHATTYSFHNPEHGITYTFRVAPLCAPNSENTINTVSVPMPCIPITELPYTEDFEHFSSNCWISEYFSTPFYHQHTALLLSRLQYYLLPEIAEPIGNLTLSGEIYGDFLVVMVKTHDNTYMAIDTIRTRRVNEWESFAVNFNNYPYSTGRIVLKSINGSYNPTYIDNIVVDITPSCPQPYGLYDTILSNTSVGVYWHAVEGATMYELEYGLHGFSHGNGTSMFVPIDSTIIFGLNHSLKYDLYIRSYCTVNDTSPWSLPITFTMPCSDITSLPYTEDFSMWYFNNNSYTVPQCWHSNASIGVRQTPLPNGDSTFSLLLGNSSTVYLPRLGRLYRPQTLQTRFTAKYNTSVNYNECLSPAPKIIVGISHSTSNNITPIDTITLSTTPTTYEVSFNSYTDTGRIIALKVQNNNYDIRVYLDEITIEYPPECQRPDMLLTTNATTTQAEITWRERGEAESWQIEYGPQGFTPDSGTLITATVNPFLLDSLVPGTTYEYRVRSLCGSGTWQDTSEWSLTRGTFTTLQLPAQTPYYCDFEDSTEALHWSELSNTNITWQYMPLSDTLSPKGYQIDLFSVGSPIYTFALYQSLNAVLYRDIDFGSDYSPSADNRYTLTFRTKAVIPEYLSWSFARMKAMVCLLNPRHPGTSSSTYLVSPWGPADSLNILTDSILHEYWYTDTIDLDTLHGVHRLVFFFSYGGSTTSVGNLILSPNTALSIDEINIFPTPCPQPLNIQIDTLGDSLANLSWIGSDTARYLFTCRNYSFSDSVWPLIYSDTVMTNRIHLTGLTPASNYAVEVQRLCPDGSLSQPSPTFYFTTHMCDSLRCDSFETDSGNTRQSTILPISYTDRYAYSQQIFPASGFSGAGSIHAVNLHYFTDFPDSSINNYSIYLGHTEKQSFANSNDFVDPTETTLSYVGPLPQTRGWGKIILDTPFEYDGEHNLVLVIHSNGNTARPLNNTVSNTTQNMSIEIRGNSEIDVSTLQSLQNFTGSRNAFTFRSQASFDFCPYCTCARPELLLPTLYYRHVTLRWQDINASIYEFSYKKSSDTGWSTLRTTDTVIELFNIIPEQEYLYRVRQICADSTVKNWTYGQFRTATNGCPPPENLHVESINPDETILQWTHDEDNYSYNVHLFNSSFDTVVTTENSQVSFNNLLHGVRYRASVQAKCSTTRPAGYWGDTIVFITPTCPNSTNLIYTELHSTSVVLDWQTEDTISGWQIAYGSVGFDQYHGTEVYADHHPFILTGLSNGQSYDAYVRSVCGTNFFSEQWSNVITFTTLFTDIHSPDPARVFTLSPNPAKNFITITFNLPFESPVHIVLRDVHGRTINDFSNTATGNSIRIPLQSPAGIYFITLITPQYTSTQKFIIE